MSRLGETSLKLLVKLFGEDETGGVSAGQTFEDYYLWQFDSSPQLFCHYPNFDPRGKTILEIGCGTGGRTAYLASVGARRVVGIDINASEIEIARRLTAELKPELKNIEFLANHEDEPPALEPFDYVMIVDAMEHLVSPAGMLKFAYSMTKPGGTCYASCKGWYHRTGSHLGILPWVNVLFSDETLLNYMRWRVSQPGYQPNRFDSDPPVERWRGLYNLNNRPGEYLNKITIRTFRKAAAYSLFEYAKVSVVPLGASRKSSPAYQLTMLLSKLPLLEEMFHSMMVGEFRRLPPGGK